MADNITTGEILEALNNKIDLPQGMSQSDVDVLPLPTTNVLTAIPQNINLILNENGLILKSGSVVYTPNGTNNFIKTTLTADSVRETVQTSANGELTVFYRAAVNQLIIYYSSADSSGNSDPTSGNITFYNTSENIIKRFDNGVLVYSDISFPLAHITVENGTIISIDKIFTSFGYIGNVIFALPNISGLIPNGRDNNSNIQNIKFTTNNPLIYINSESNLNSKNLCINNTTLSSDTINYNSDTNYNYTTNENTIIYNTNCGYFSTDSDGKITQLNINNTFSLVSNNNSSNTHNIGDIFWTTRTDSALNGAVEANGAQYNFADVNGGDNNVQALLTSGALPSVSIAKFDAMVAEQGGCDSFGYGTPKMVKIYPAGNVTEQPFIYIELTDEQYSSFYDTMNNCKENEILPYRLYDINTTKLLNGYYLKCTDATIGVFVVFNNEDEETSFRFLDHGSYYVTTDGSKTIPDPDKSQTDPTTYFKVPKKTPRILVRCQKPTVDNDYTWYNVYADGWVEQGGTVNGGTSQTATFPVEMADTKYTIAYGNRSGTYEQVRTATRTTTSITIKNANNAGTVSTDWQVSGYAAPAEYTKDKWDYQNVQVERPMVQLFNSATDEAVAKCTEVLSDVAGLKQATDGMIDYVVESQDPTPGNGYTWYRLYKSGWIEQGVVELSFTTTRQTFTLPVEMADTNYNILTSKRSGNLNYSIAFVGSSTTVKYQARAGSPQPNGIVVSGMSAQ